MRRAIDAKFDDTHESPSCVDEDYGRVCADSTREAGHWALGSGRWVLGAGQTKRKRVSRRARRARRVKKKPPRATRCNKRHISSIRFLLTCRASRVARNELLASGHSLFRNPNEFI